MTPALSQRDPSPLLLQHCPLGVSAGGGPAPECSRTCVVASQILGSRAFTADINRWQRLSPCPGTPW